mmetsp:Transcript_5035/g.9269  ORF Transcript_5035/g.9269 Transcript_5035/m.9269 type:complete len:234 (-) Transcript_5035:1466-2167(-)
MLASCSTRHSKMSLVSLSVSMSSFFLSAMALRAWELIPALPPNPVPPFRSFPAFFAYAFGFGFPAFVRTTTSGSGVEFFVFPSFCSFCSDSRSSASSSCCFLSFSKIAFWRDEGLPVTTASCTSIASRIITSCRYDAAVAHASSESMCCFLIWKALHMVFSMCFSTLFCVVLFFSLMLLYSPTPFLCEFHCVRNRSAYSKIRVKGFCSSAITSAGTTRGKYTSTDGVFGALTK